MVEGKSRDNRLSKNTRNGIIPTSNSKITDNQGRELTKEQQEYFKDSKVRDENGNLLEVYHGTPMGDFNVYDKTKLGNTTEAKDSKLGFHLTDNKDERKNVKGNEYIVFDSNQIKNVDNLNPTMNEDIRYADRNLTPREIVEREQIEEISDTIKKIVESNKDNPFTPKKIERLAHKLYNATVDNLHFMHEMVKDIETLTGEVEANKNPYILAMNGRKSAGTRNYIIHNNLVDMDGNIIGESLESIIKSVPKGKVKEFEDYLLHKHNVARYQNNAPVFGKGFTDKMSENVISKYETRYPEFKKLANRYYDFWNKFMQNWAVDSGLMSEQSYKDLREKYPFYIPTNRAFIELEKDKKGLFSGRGRKYVNQAKIIKKATGSERNIIRPFESIITNIEKISLKTIEKMLISV